MQGESRWPTNEWFVCCDGPVACVPRAPLSSMSSLTSRNGLLGPSGQAPWTSKAAHLYGAAIPYDPRGVQADQTTLMSQSEQGAGPSGNPGRLTPLLYGVPEIMK